MRQLSMRSKKSAYGYGFIAPWIIGFVLFTAYPLLYSIYLSFQEVKLTPQGIQTTFVQFQNYEYAFAVDGLFVQKLLAFFYKNSS